MLGKPFVAGIILASVASVPVILLVWTRGQEVSEEGPKSAGTPGVGRAVAGPRRAPARGPRVSRKASPTPSSPAGATARALAARLREAILAGGDVASVLVDAKGQESEAMRAYLSLIHSESDLRLFAKLTHSLAGLPDPSGDILAYCQREAVEEDRPIVKLLLVQILEGRPEEGSIPALREVLNQFWHSEDAQEGWSVLRAALRGLGKIDSGVAREEVWKRFWAAPTDDLKSEALSALALRMDDTVIDGIQNVIANSTLPEEVRIGAVQALATGLKNRPSTVVEVLETAFNQVEAVAIRAELIRTAAESGERPGLGFAEDRLTDTREAREIRLAAALALRHYGDERSLVSLNHVANLPGDSRLSALCRAAAEAIRRRSGD